MLGQIESWRPVRICPEFYEVSDHGHVRRIGKIAFGKWQHRGGCLRGAVNGNGYLNVVLCFNGKRVNRGIHQLVADAFIGERPAGKEVNHRDSDKLNNHSDNLEYVTKLENMNHAIRAGRRWVPCGEACVHAKLSEAAVMAIREEAYAKGRPYGCRDMARRYGVSKCTIRRIVDRVIWKHVGSERQKDGTWREKQ